MHNFPEHVENSESCQRVYQDGKIETYNLFYHVIYHKFYCHSQEKKLYVQTVFCSYVYIIRLYDFNPDKSL